MARTAVFKRVVDVGVRADTPASEIKHIRACNIAALASGISIAYWVPVSFGAGAWVNGLENLGAAMGYATILVVNRLGKHVAACVSLMLLAHFQLYWALAHHGVQSGTMLWYLVLVPVPFLVFPRRARRVATSMAIFTVVVLIVLTARSERYTFSLGLQDPAQMMLSNTALVGVGLLVIAASFVRTGHATELALSEAQAHADHLLLNVLPPSVVGRLKRSPKAAIADRYDEATVLFADIVGFTPLSARVSALETVKLLNRVFSAFDAICERHGVEKIRTIGDGYMVVSGAPEPRSDHATALAHVAIEMRDHVSALREEVPLQVRIGLNSGELVAGVVGTSRFHYDVWGDTVNVAARMESLGEPGKIQLAEGTWSRIKDEFSCTSNGPIQVKGKGEMETWFLEGRLPIREAG